MNQGVELQQSHFYFHEKLKHIILWMELVKDTVIGSVSVSGDKDAVNCK